MPTIGRVLETSLYVDQLDRAAIFYERIFGFERIQCDDRFCAFNISGQQVLLLFARGKATAPVAIPAGGPGVSSGLPSGEYACYGSGGRLLIGLGFKVPSTGTYTDLDRKSKGTYTIQAGIIAFHGGHLDGQTGRNLRGNKFVLGSMVSCEPFH